jgi:hypothetical protein
MIERKLVCHCLFNVRVPDVLRSNYVVLALVNQKFRRELSHSDSKTDSEGIVQQSLFFSGAGSGMMVFVIHSTILLQSKDQIGIDEWKASNC